MQSIRWYVTYWSLLCYLQKCTSVLQLGKVIGSSLSFVLWNCYCCFKRLYCWITDIYLDCLWVLRPVDFLICRCCASLWMQNWTFFVASVYRKWPHLYMLRFRLWILHFLQRIASRNHFAVFGCEILRRWLLISTAFRRCDRHQHGFFC